MIRFAWYRKLQVLRGGRSFVKLNGIGDHSYALVGGNSDASTTLASELIGMGFKEEWPKKSRGES